MASKARVESRGGVRAYQQDPPAGSGGAGAGGSAPATPPAGSGLPGAGPGGGGPPASGAGQQPPSPAVIPADVLPKELQGKSEAEIRMTLTGIVDSLRVANQRNFTLQEELRKKERAPATREDPPPKPKSTKPLSDRLLEEPEAALEEFFAERAGPTLARLQEIQSRLGSAETDLIRSKVPDFDEHAEDIERILGDGPRTQENLMGAYTMALGLKTLEERQRAARASLNSETPRDEPPSNTPTYQKTALSEEIRIGLGMGEDDYYNKYAHSSVYDLVKVPT